MFPLERIATIVGGALHTTSPHQRRLSPSAIRIDSRDIEPGDLFVTLPGARTDGRAFVRSAFASGAIAAMLSPAPEADPHGWGVRHPWIEVSDPLQALTSLATAWRGELSAAVIAVTGTNGKTTTKDLLAHILSEAGLTHASPGNRNTEIGVPLSVLSTPRDAQYCVFEAAADRPGDLAPLNRILLPHGVIVTGAGRGHLDSFISIDAVAEEKWQLVRTRPPSSWAIVNGDDDRLRERALASDDPHLITFGIDRHVSGVTGELLTRTPELCLRIDGRDPPVRCPLLGRHNATNLLAAVSAAACLGISWQLIAQQTATFRPPRHRLTLRRGLPWGTLLDDSYNANPDSTLAALDVLEALTSRPSERTVVFGEMHGLGPFAESGHRIIAERLVSLGVSAVAPYGKAAIDAVSARPDLPCLEHEDGLGNLAAALRAHMIRHPGVLLIKGSHALGLDRLADLLAKETSGVRS